MFEKLQLLINEEIEDKNTTTERRYEILSELKRLNRETGKPEASVQSQDAHSQDA